MRGRFLVDLIDRRNLRRNSSSFKTNADALFENQTHNDPVVSCSKVFFLNKPEKKKLKEKRLKRFNVELLQ